MVYPDPRAAFDRLKGLIGAHGLEPLLPAPGIAEYRFEENRVTITLTDATLDLALSAGDRVAFAFLKQSAEEHLAEAEPEQAVSVVWSDAGALAEDAPLYREITLLRRSEPYPGTVRFTFAAERLAGCESAGLHVRLLVPPSQEGPLRWPEMSGGSLTWPTGASQLAVRAYTLRHLRPAEGEVDIDVVMHGDRALAGWASGARPGDRLAMMGPGGKGIPEGDEAILIGGDETALPAIARIFEARPDLSGRAILSAPAEARADLSLPQGIEAEFLAPGDREGLGRAMLDAVEQFPPSGQLWFAAEAETARALRNRAKALGFPPDRRSVSAFWRHGKKAAT